MSERTVYAIASGKGGVGKTTTAINLGAMLADRDYDVVIVDTDLGMANLAGFLDVEIEPPTLHEVLAGDADAEDAIYSGPGGIDVLPSATDIEGFARSDPTNLGGVVADLRESYDYVLLDTGAGVSYDVLVPLALADGVLLVATPDVASVRDTAKSGELADRVETEVVGAVLAQRSSDILNADDVEETLGTDVLAVVPQDEAVPMGIDAGRPLAAFAPNAPAGQAYRELAEVLIGEADPDPELDLGSDGDVDSMFDVDPPQQADNSGSGADQSANQALAEEVQDAIDGDGESDGLLGGELASAAREIREQAGGNPGAATGGWAESATEQEGESGNEQEAELGNEQETVGADANDARSVDDLIDEHMGEDPLGEDGTFGDEDDDPLAGVDDEHPESDRATGEEVAGADSVSDDADSEVGGVPFNEDRMEFEEDEQASPTEGGSQSSSHADGSQSSSSAGDNAGVGSGQSETKAPETEAGRTEAGGMGAEPNGPDAEPNGPSAESNEMETERSEPSSQSVEEERSAKSALSEKSKNDDDESSGVLGRLSSLFK